MQTHKHSEIIIEAFQYFVLTRVYLPTANDLLVMAGDAVRYKKIKGHRDHIGTARHLRIALRDAVRRGKVRTD